MDLVAVLVKTNTVFNFKAKDPSGANLSWSINWGDNKGLSKICPSSYPNTTFNIGHAWDTVGTYNVKLGVSNCTEGGDARASFNVVVKMLLLFQPQPQLQLQLQLQPNSNSNSNSNS